GSRPARGRWARSRGSPALGGATRSARSTSSASATARSRSTGTNTTSWGGRSSSSPSRRGLRQAAEASQPLGGVRQRYAGRRRLAADYLQGGRTRVAVDLPAGRLAQLVCRL